MGDKTISYDEYIRNYRVPFNKRLYSIISGDEWDRLSDGEEILLIDYYESISISQYHRVEKLLEKFIEQEEKFDCIKGSAIDNTMEIPKFNRNPFKIPKNPNLEEFSRYVTDKQIGFVYKEINVANLSDMMELVDKYRHFCSVKKWQRVTIVVALAAVVVAGVVVYKAYDNYKNQNIDTNIDDDVDTHSIDIIGDIGIGIDYSEQIHSSWVSGSRI